ncbi:MAG TPA: RGCVC family protein [Pseudonocardiaceae bacterium]|nr:RGCVC family protein [Pseudonocardiaceae bacterium]
MKCDTEIVVDEACSVCAHPMRAHDGIATRFCAATLAGALDRGCACPPGG